MWLSEKKMYTAAAKKKTYLGKYLMYYKEAKWKMNNAL